LLRDLAPSPLHIFRTTKFTMPSPRFFWFRVPSGAPSPARSDGLQLIRSKGPTGPIVCGVRTRRMCTAYQHAWPATQVSQRVGHDTIGRKCGRYLGMRRHNSPEVLVQKEPALVATVSGEPRRDCARNLQKLYYPQAAAPARRAYPSMFVQPQLFRFAA
jgi:hypothetical protein